MIGFLGAVLIAFVAAIVAAPLWRTVSSEPLLEPAYDDELWKHEKAVALLAITEADFDRATGKLSNDDYMLLRDDYEGRALRAIGELERLETLPEAPHAASTRFCGQCGARFEAPDRYCSSCGTRRG